LAPSTPRDIVRAVRAFARRNDILRPGPLVLAVSGGTDSTALALVMAELAAEFGLVLHVAHFDHRTRPRDAAADAAFVASLADRIGAPVRVGRAERPTKSENEARRERYAFLRRVAESVGATAIATGHTRDDQAETVLLHLARGSGLVGLAGMRPLRAGIARPLLAIGRAETEAMCRAAGIRPREDPSNRSLRFARNRIRLKVLPELEAINPQVRAALARFAEAAAEAETILGASASDASRDPGVDPTPGATGPATLVRAIDVRALPRDRVPRERALASAWRAAMRTTLTTRHRTALMALAASTDGSRRLDLPGGAAIREYSALRFVPAQALSRRAPDAPRRDPTPLERGATVEWHGWRIALGMEEDGLRYTGRIEGPAAGLAVRGRRPGDRVARTKLQDVFVDRKVPSRLRDTWPVITLNDEVVWVPGLTPAPRGGRTRIAAGPVGDDPTEGQDLLGSFAPKRQVASKSEARQKGEKRGRP
jgi:tRNA(Ile)-lysidine synthase